MPYDTETARNSGNKECKGATNMVQRGLEIFRKKSGLSVINIRFRLNI